MKYLLLSFISFAQFINATIYKSNTTDLSKCSVSYSRTGSTYKEFYPIYIKDDGGNGSLMLDFHFAVLASSDAHILLAPSENVDKSDPVYEIVIGAGGNTFSDIRRMQKSEVKASVRIKGLLSALDPHFFWLHITRDGRAGGLIEVGREGDNSSFISWLDPDPLPLKVISFSTWSGIEAKWYFDCDRSGNEEEIEKKLTTLEKLRRNLLNQYDPLVRPVINRSTITTVSMSINLKYLELNEHKSTMELRGSMNMRWHDEKLKWSPGEYGGIQVMHIFRKEIWQPELLCYSAVGNPKDILQDSMMVVHHTGQVEWNPVLHVLSWCGVGKLGSWPRDTHKCNIQFGFIRDFMGIELEFNESDSALLQHGSSQWLVLEASIFGIEPNTTTDEAIFSMFFQIRRSSNIYNTIFFTPFLVIAIFLLLSFWISPFGYMKISMGCAELILETIMLLALALFVPNSSNGVPFLISLYSWCLVGSLVSLIISVIVINYSRNKQQKPLSHLLCNILTSKLIKNVLYLPNVVMPDEYGDLNAQTSKIEDKDQTLWILLGIAIDRITFLVYTCLISYIIGMYVVSCF